MFELLANIVLMLLTIGLSRISDTKPSLLKEQVAKVWMVCTNLQGSVSLLKLANGLHGIPHQPLVLTSGKYRYHIFLCLFGKLDFAMREPPLVQVLQHQLTMAPCSRAQPSLTRWPYNSGVFSSVNSLQRSQETCQLSSSGVPTSSICPSLHLSL